mmetsp:Transcript_92626/g.239816  ORF Transcript_92626/g.239816 Transcript_92626/m.239816 type:complete len:389 (+) Transcript_92626:159-1325(+)
MATASLPSTTMMTVASERLGAAVEGDLGFARQAAIGTPLRAFLERLSSVNGEGCPWQGYLPAKCRASLLHREASLQSSAAGLPAGQSGLGGAFGDGSIKGNVWNFSRDAAGCRLVQRAIEEAESDAHREALAAELHGHVWEALQCPHANHVMQKCVFALRPEATQFIIDELSARGGVLQAARHKYGCRIVQRLIEFLPWSQTRGLVECLLQEVSTISRHAYGNYVMQNLLQHGTQEQRDCILRAVEEDVRGFAEDPYGAAVVGGVLLHGGAAARCKLAAALVEDDGLLLSMACTRLGYSSIERVLEALHPEARQEALRQLRSQADTLLASRFGRQVLESLPLEAVGTQRQQLQPQPQHLQQQGSVCNDFAFSTDNAAALVAPSTVWQA